MLINLIVCFIIALILTWLLWAGDAEGRTPDVKEAVLGVLWLYFLLLCVDVVGHALWYGFIELYDKI